MAGKVSLAVVGSFMSIHVVLDGFHVCVEVVSDFRVVVKWVRNCHSGNVRRGDVARNVSSVRVTSWEKMWVFNVSNRWSVSSIDVNSRSQIRVN